MKTLTEFDGFRLKNALNTKKELTTAGKTPEELPAAMGEALKLEGDKLTLFLAALDEAEKRSDNLKRVVVFTVEEGKKAPSGAVEKDGKWFLAEYFYVPQARPAGRDRKGGDRDGKRGGRGGKRGGRGGKGGRGDRDRGPRKEGGEAQAAGAPGEKKNRPPRGPRPPRKDKPAGGPPQVKPNPTPATAQAPASAESSTTEPAKS